MRVLLSTIGSRGDVQPLVALALQLRELGQQVRFCVPPDFREWIEGLGFAVTPIGPEVRPAALAGPPKLPAGVSPEDHLRQVFEATVATQFEAVGAAAAGCDLIVGATALQVGTRSVADPCPGDRRAGADGWGGGRGAATGRGQRAAVGGGRGVSRETPLTSPNSGCPGRRAGGA